MGFALTYLLCFIYLDDQDNKSLIHYGIFVGAAASFLLGFIDDFYPLGAKVKFLVQIIIGVMAYQFGLSIDRVAIPFTDVVLQFGFFSMWLTVIWIVAIMNLINLIDGLDGLAGGIGLLLMGLLAFLAYESGVAISFVLALGMVGAIFGFLFHNFPPSQSLHGRLGCLSHWLCHCRALAHQFREGHHPCGADCPSYGACLAHRGRCLCNVAPRY